MTSSRPSPSMSTKSGYVGSLIGSIPYGFCEGAGINSGPELSIKRAVRTPGVPLNVAAGRKRSLVALCR